MRIIHISDLHLCQTFKKNNISKVKKLIKHISELGIDHLVITGDISDNANEKDYLILKKILQAFNLYSSGKTTIIPGNHDIFGGVQRAEDILNFPAKCGKIDYKEKLEVFVRTFKELFSNTYFPNQSEYFPFAKPVDDVVLIGLNTTDKYSKLKNPFASNGKVYKSQFKGLVDILSAKSFENFTKIVLSHHHFYGNCDEVKSSESAIWNKIEKYTMKLKGKKKLLKVFNEYNVSLVLHGHSHDMKEYRRKGITFLNAGNSFENSGASGYQMFQLGFNGSEITAKIVNSHGNLPHSRNFPLIEENALPGKN
jgi:3',5'-cyclic AMP phosphodiesterase CpdA